MKVRIYRLAGESFQSPKGIALFPSRTAGDPVLYFCHSEADKMAVFRGGSTAFRGSGSLALEPGAVVVRGVF